MTSHSTTHRSSHQPTIISYVYGFLLSLLLTLGAFWFSPLFGKYAAAFIVVSAVLQLVVQLVFFLHLGKRSAPSWHRGVFAFTLLIVAILIGGTLWIMHNLARLHEHHAPAAPTIEELYEGGEVTPANELL